MRLEGITDIAAPRARVWEALTDPRQVGQCVPGNPEIQVVDDRHLRAKAPVGSGFLRTTVVIEIALTSLDAPSRATATATGSAMGGSGSATATLDLSELAPASTRVAWAADLTLSGMLSGFGSMVEGPARNGVDGVLGCLKSRLEAEERARAGAQ